jgi:hypothetical protein
MLLKEIIAVYSDNYTKPRNTLCGQIVELLNVKVGGTCSYHSFLKVQRCITCTYGETGRNIGQAFKTLVSGAYMTGL